MSPQVYTTLCTLWTVLSDPSINGTIWGPRLVSGSRDPGSEGRKQTWVEQKGGQNPAK